MIAQVRRAIALPDLLLWVGMAVICIAILGYSFFRYAPTSSDADERESQNRDAQADLTPAPPIALTAQDGSKFTNADVEGKLWVVDFVFTNCAGPCPLMTTNMRALQKRIGHADDIHFVSISCDPWRDTPQALSAYADAYKADTANWTFLTGTWEEIQQVAQAFLVTVTMPDTPTHESQPAEPEMTGDIIHSTRFILVNRQGQIVGSYQGTEIDELERLVEEINSRL